MTIDKTTVNCPLCDATAHYDFSSRDLMFDHYDRYDYFSCSECKSVFIHPMPSPEEVNTFYPADYCVFEQNPKARKISQVKQAVYWYKHSYTHLEPSGLFKFLAAILSPFYNLDKPDYVENGKLLDVGCGNGRYLATMRSLGWDVQGVELSEDGLKVCLASGLPVHHGDLKSASFADDSFDVITVRHVIEHIRESHPFMTELARTLKPDGKLIIVTPNSDAFALGRDYLGANWYANDVPRHLILFSRDNLGQLASKHGLQPYKSWFETTPKIILNSLDYVIKNKGKPSNRIRWRRSLSRLYLWLARYTKRGDVIHSVFTK
ncbi:MAG: hypothetical protein COA83_08560 [Methylophaga sp.]|nr:MAG: hypothetical protein COA83_08560 [Methylophaga sp.]